MNPDELKNRAKQFALPVITLIAAMPKSIEGRAIEKELKLLPSGRVKPLLVEAK
jgi:hypothetical protein